MNETCPRCSGYLVTTDPAEPYCVQCGHRTAWSTRPSDIGSAMAQYGAPSPRLPRGRIRRGPILPKHRFPLKTAMVWLEDGRRLSLQYVKMSPRTAICEGVVWGGDVGRRYLTDKAAREARVAFRRSTGMMLTGLGAREVA